LSKLSTRWAIFVAAAALVALFAEPIRSITPYEFRRPLLFAGMGVFCLASIWGAFVRSPTSVTARSRRNLPIISGMSIGALLFVIYIESMQCEYVRGSIAGFLECTYTGE
jgi:hypothetical protein